jgi:acyl-CoA reductase-like NAD-dependent aldehyde dehydrogenase
MLQKPDLPDLPALDKVFIGGSWQASQGGTEKQIFCPADEEFLTSVTEPSTADADAAVSAARKAFDEGPWPRMSVEERAKVCDRFADALEARFDRMSMAWMLEAGAPLAHGEMINNGAGTASWRDTIAKARSLAFEETRSSDAGEVLLIREPIGPVLAILTYNGPVVLMGMKVMPALLAGCPVIIKPAPETDLTSRIVAEAIEEAEFPPGVVSMLTAGIEVTQHLVEHPDVDMISLTGGTAIAIDVIRRSSYRLARTSLELGGKSPAIVADDADLPTILPHLVGGSTGFQGQVCVTLSRVLVSRNRYDEVTEALASAYDDLKIGLPWDETIDRGPLAVERARDRAEAAVAGAVKQGASIVTGGKRPAQFQRGWYYEPTLLAGIDNSMDIAQEEVFGPVTAMIPYDDMDDAIRIANDSKYGLAASVFSGSTETAIQVARQIRSGGVAINTAGVSLTEPFGGVKQSGWGRECGAEGVLEFTDIKQMLLSGSSIAS